MKQLQKEGVGSKHRQAESLTQEQEEQLWKKGVLGQHTGRSVVNTMLFMCGSYFALCSAQEHRALRYFPSQIELVEDQVRGLCCGMYTEDALKNHQGGLKGRKSRPKVVLHHENTDNPSHCFVYVSDNASSIFINLVMLDGSFIHSLHHAITHVTLSYILYTLQALRG